MERYPSYRLEDIYRKSFREGGLTLQQVHCLFEHTQKRLNDKLELQALMHGIDVNADDKEGSQERETREQKSIQGSVKTNDRAQKPRNQQMPIFRDPSEYEGMTKEEKDRMTREMMAQHKQWVRGQSDWKKGQSQVGLG